MSPGRWDDPWRSFPASAPLPVADGLTTRSRRGAMAESWWSRRFTDVLESYGLGARMQRGRRYARAGQVMSSDITAGLLAAQVQGSRRTPYLVTIKVRTPGPRQWRAIEAALRERIGLAAHLLAGEVPPELADVFDEAKSPLFPQRWSDLTARCSCPDDANPCKHVAAVLYVFADRLDTDPWLLLQWRGRTREEVLAAVGLADDQTGAQDDPAPWWPLRPGEAPSAHDGGTLDEPFPDPPSTPHSVLQRLADLDVLVWRAPATEALAALYAAVPRQGPDASNGASGRAGS